ncbi:MAG: M20 family metallopeptidase [Candidatus Dormiibacterota bacterium]
MPSKDDEIWAYVDAKRDEFVALSDRVWGMPELNFAEERSGAEHARALEREGFRVTRNVGGLPTAVIGEAGDGGPVVGILGEYDALPGLSQEAGVAEPRPVAEGGNGHGCGHNLLGAGSLLAATAVKDYLAAKGLAGRVRYYGCPAEEGGSGKAFMVRAGAFDDVDVAVSWHPSSFIGVFDAAALANTMIDFAFTGRASHAAAAPELGRSALDAVELMNVGVNYLREHMSDRARIHYAVLDTGGIAPNVVQAKANVRYMIRGVDLAEVTSLLERVRKVADGAALMTETSVEGRIRTGMSNLVGNAPLERTMQAILERLGPPDFDDEDRAIAAMFQATFRPEDIAAAYRREGLQPRSDAVLCDGVTPLDAKGEGGRGSTDVGDVSWVVPTVQTRGATAAIGTPGHSWQITGQGKTEHAKKGMVQAAKAMASTALVALTDAQLREDAKQELRERTGGPYQSPVPDGVEPPLDFSRGA